MLALRTCCGDVFGAYGLYIILYYIYICVCFVVCISLFCGREKNPIVFRVGKHETLLDDPGSPRFETQLILVRTEWTYNEIPVGEGWMSRFM